jgi:chitinase
VWQYPNAKGDWAQTVRGSGGDAPAPPAPAPSGGSDAPAPAPSGGATPPPSSGGCAAWAAGTVYTQGKTASYNGKTYTAQWWTEGETPSSSSAWKEGGSC